ncbi:branched-chain amino acid ABC transporter permease [Paraburkholderia sp. CNPSo 3155]|uniref:branched-chain amino acid ABC transporter permease n=1 Tax=Paraburkholderia atlantica TaxID=2654982 RepID=UPI00128E64E5|nr:branched-chain amino acid ABC transporter permease [Paraburkholderia atlantica]MPW11167.1 branched-chain amino acid ABC transporter permease [Paraburkholderia atlantica]
MLLIQTLNGLSYAAVLFTMALGFSLIFGIMRVMHFGHAGLAMASAFVAQHLAISGQPFWVAIVGAAAAAGIAGFVVERLLIRRIYMRDHVAQILLTIGLSYVIEDVVLWLWGGDIRAMTLPDSLAGVLEIGGYPFPVYRLVVIAYALVWGAALAFLFSKTRWGDVLQAAIADPDMAAAIGINTRKLFAIVFVSATVLSGLSAAVVAPITQVYVGMDGEDLFLSLIVVIVGGIGSLPGTLAGALVLGFTDTLIKALWPDLSQIGPYAMLLIVLISRPQGLLGKKELVRV